MWTYDLGCGLEGIALKKDAAVLVLRSGCFGDWNCWLAARACFLRGWLEGRERNGLGLRGSRLHTQVLFGSMT